MIFTEKEVQDGGLLCPATALKNPCKVSKCMAWRWQSTPPVDSDLAESLAKLGLDPTIKMGYCGLAGPPV
ncbi:MAG: hypothetical protein WBA34_10100 [Candidatus Deferrimicrobiaceae bacterium]